jgi:hypothetical protein
MKTVSLFNLFLPWQSWICYHAKQIAEIFHILQLFFLSQSVLGMVTLRVSLP